MPSIEEVQAENVELKAKLDVMQMKMMTLRFFTGKPDLDHLASCVEANADIQSPDTGARVKVVHPGSKYNAKDFEKAGTFESFKGEYADAVVMDAMGVIVQKAPHFKKTTMEVFLIKFDNNKAAIMSRKGFELPLYPGCGVQIANQGCKYASKDFKGKEGFSDLLTIVDEVRQGQKAILIRTAPHYKTKAPVFVVALDDCQKCAIMAAKGIAGLDPPGLKQKLTARKAEKEAAEEEAKKATEEKKEADPAVEES